MSRELGIPCVIGTKLATRVLKDGDEVDVNANHGVITVIKRESNVTFYCLVMLHKHIRVYERDHIYPQSIAPYLKLIKFSPKNHRYIANGWEVMVYLDNYFWWARDTDYLEKAARRWFAAWLKK